MNCIVIFSALLAVALGYSSGGHSSGGHVGFGSVVSKRNAAPATQDDVFNFIKQTVSKAHSGTTIQELSQAAGSVLTLVDDLLSADSTPVDPIAIRAQIGQSMEEFGAQTTVSVLFDDVMTYEGEKMAAALKLWEHLVDTARKQQASGESTRTTLAAIRQTAMSMNNIVDNTVSAFTELLRLPEQTQEHNKKTRAIVSKRGWSAGLDAGYGSHSGASVGVSIGYSF